jgi:hypothetical protein
MSNTTVVRTENISSIVNNMNEEGLNSIEVSIQYRVMNKPVECSLTELECVDGETTIKEFLEDKVINEDYFYDDDNEPDLSLYVEGWNEEDTIAEVVSDMKEPSIENTVENVAKLMKENPDKTTEEIVRIIKETPVDEPVLSATAEYYAKKEVEVSLKTLNEYKNANPENTMGDVLQETLECPYSVEEWEVL